MLLYIILYKLEVTSIIIKHHILKHRIPELRTKASKPVACLDFEVDRALASAVIGVRAKRQHSIIIIIVIIMNMLIIIIISFIYCCTVLLLFALLSLLLMLLLLFISTLLLLLLLLSLSIILS